MTEFRHACDSPRFNHVSTLVGSKHGKGGTIPIYMKWRQKQHKAGMDEAASRNSAEDFRHLIISHRHFKYRKNPTSCVLRD